MDINNVNSMDYTTFREDSRNIHIGQNVTKAEFAQLQQKNAKYKDVSFSSLDTNSDGLINKGDFGINVARSASSSRGGDTPSTYNIPPGDIVTTGGVNKSEGLEEVDTPAQVGDLEIVVLG